MFHRIITQQSDIERVGPVTSLYDCEKDAGYIEDFGNGNTNDKPSVPTSNEVPESALIEYVQQQQKISPKAGDVAITSVLTSLDKIHSSERQN